MDKVVAKMKCNTLSKSGDARHPNCNIQLGAVYSNDPESENKSFASATPSGSVQLNIDPARPASNFFELGAEYYVTFTKASEGVWKYLKDGGWPSVTGENTTVVLRKRADVDEKETIRAVWTPSVLEATVDGTVVKAGWGMEEFLTLGFTHWRHLREGEQ